LWTAGLAAGFEGSFFGKGGGERDFLFLVLIHDGVSVNSRDERREQERGAPFCTIRYHFLIFQ